MARPTKYNLQYFPLDVDFFTHHKMLMIEEDFGVKGGYMAIRLMAMVYEKGYYLEWKDNSELSCAKRVGNGFTGALVGEILKSCLKHGLFSQRLFEEFRILTSAGIQERWVQVMQQLRRKAEISSEFTLISSEETRVNDEETTLPDAEMPPKEIKQKESKKKHVAPAPPAPPKNLKSSVSKKNKQESEAEPFWQDLVDVYFCFIRKNFPGEEPSFSGRDPKIFKQIIHQLKKRAEKKQKEWACDFSKKSLSYFLDLAIADDWLKKHFLLENLLKQFDSVFQRAVLLKTASVPGSKLKQTHASTLSHAEKLKIEVSYLVERYGEGNFDSSVIDPDLYDKMVMASFLPAGTMSKHKGTIEEQKISAIIEFLKIQNQKNVESV